MTNLSPRQRQIAVALIGAGVLALIAILARRRGVGGAQDPNATTDPSGQAGSTFADNGEAAGGLSTAITDGLGDVATGLQGVQDQYGGVVDAVGGLAAAVQDLQGRAASEPTPISVEFPAFTYDPAAAPVDSGAAAVAAATPNGDQRRANLAKRGIFTQTRGTRAGREFKLAVNPKTGKRVRLYESAAGRGDFGKKAGTRIAAGYHPNAKPQPRPKPKGRTVTTKRVARKPAPHRPPPRPSRPPSRAHKPPPRRGRRR